MLNSDFLNTYVSIEEMLYGVEWSEESEIELSRPIPTLRPVATINYHADGVYSRPEAVIYPLPDGTLVRLRIKDDSGYDYENARVVPLTHPVYLAHQQDPDKLINIVPSHNLQEEDRFNKQHPAYAEYREHNVHLVISPSQDRELGARVSERDIAWLKEIIEAQTARAIVELRDQGLIS